MLEINKCIPRPETLTNLLPRNYLSRPLQKEAQDRKRLLLHPKPYTAPPQLPRGKIGFKLPKSNRRRLSGAVEHGFILPIPKLTFKTKIALLTANHKFAPLYEVHQQVIWHAPGGSLWCLKNLSQTDRKWRTTVNTLRMTSVSLRHNFLCVAILAALPLSTARAQNAITQWNEIATTQARASTAPGSATAGGTSVYVAYPTLAAYNAVVAIQGKYQPYMYSVSAPSGASADAAVVEAAYRTLLYLLPDRAAQLTASYTASMLAIPNGQPKLDGQAVGLASANQLIALRTGDGRGVPWPYSYPSAPVPGVWILTPGTLAPQTPWMGHMMPFTFDDPAQYLPDEPPPALSSQTWADDYNQTRTLGAANSTVRTPAQTEIALFWTDHTAAQYGRLLRLLAVQENLSLLESARLMALSYTSLADSFIGCMNAKYYFSFWRPVTAIRNGDIDGNPNTPQDASWSPLVTTPGHPEYPAAHGCVTGALAGALQSYFGTPNIPLTISSNVTGTTHHYTNIHDWEKEVEYSRIYAGFHYHHSLVQGFVLGSKVANHISGNFFEPQK